MMRHRNLFTNVKARLRMRARRFSPVAIAVLLCVASRAPAAIIPTFYSSLDDDASITSTGGATQNAASAHTYATPAAGAIGAGAFQSTVSTANSGGWAKWSDAAVSTIFNSWTATNGITVDLYFKGSFTGSTNSEGFWSMVRRDPGDPPATGGDQYFITSALDSSSVPGRLRVLFSNNSNTQYKFTFDNAAHSGEVTTGKDLPLTSNQIYHLTVTVGNSQLNVYLDDVGDGNNQYSNLSPVYTYTIPETAYYWQLPPAGAVTSGSGRLIREMDVGNRGGGNGFGGTLRNGNWVDEVNIYNGIYTPSDLGTAVPEPAAVCLLALALPMLFLSRKRG